jgi:hypothetical protein
MFKDNSTFMTLIVDKDYKDRLFYFRVFEKKEDVPEHLNYTRGQDFLYAFEMNAHIEFGHSKSEHINSIVSVATGRVALLGPVRDIDTVMKEVKFMIQDWKSKEKDTAYDFDSLETFIGTPNQNDFPGLFQLAQSNYADGFKGQDRTLHSFDKGQIVRDLIIPAKLGRVNLVIFETKDGVRTGDEITVNV